MPRKPNKAPNSFTLVEVLIAIGIIAILSTVVILTLNPAELTKQSRDSTRILNLKTLNVAFATFEAANPGASLGSASTTYVSLIDSTSTCANLSLPALAAGYSYHCSTSTALAKNINGTGWLPMDFTQGVAIPPLDELPLDPVNQASGGLYYAYNSPGTVWQVQINTVLESAKYKPMMSSDGGVSDQLYEVGSNLNIPGGG